MRAVVQRVKEASVFVEGDAVGRIEGGLLVLVGATHGDTPADAEALAAKLGALRIFADAAGKMNRSVVEVGGEILVVSQFTLYGTMRRGRRPSFTAAAPAEVAEPLVEMVVSHLKDAGVSVAAGRFGAHMTVHLVNDGPVTLVIDVEDGAVR